MKTYENENQINFESKDRWGNNELEVFSHDDGDLAFDAENSDAKVTVILTKEDAKEMIRFLQSKI